jgi:soluble lytic murein transglycosylase
MSTAAQRQRSPRTGPPSRPARRSPARRSAARRRTVRRRRAGLVVAAAAIAGLLATLMWPSFDHAVKEIKLPLRHEDIIRQQAREKDLDPALIAAVIYAESRFREGQTSHAGATGLMQITPATAQDIARKSGGTEFVVGDLATPQVNISYGAWYLRYLLGRYGGNETLALAAYNGGEGNVDRWIDSARQRERDLTISEIPFPETRHYVRAVHDAHVEYRRSYAAELGI